MQGFLQDLDSMWLGSMLLGQSARKTISSGVTTARGLRDQPKICGECPPLLNEIGGEGGIFHSFIMFIHNLIIRYTDEIDI